MPPLNINKCISIPLRSINSIPLTEEWLIKAGLMFRGKLRFLNNHDNGKYYLGFNGYAYKIEVKHVHQLQNLYFALKGKELELKF